VQTMTVRTFTNALACHRRNKRDVKQCWHAQKKNRGESFGPFARRLTRRRRRE